MYMRLAFAIAAHLEPEILLIDEVLAVGDAQFEKKSLAKMEELATKDGRTVIFVSHSMSTISRLCPRVIWLRGGQVAADGAANDVIQQYSDIASVDQPRVSWPEGIAKAGITEIKLMLDGLVYKNWRQA